MRPNYPLNKTTINCVRIESFLISVIDNQTLSGGVKSLSGRFLGIRMRTGNLSPFEEAQKAHETFVFS